MVLEDILDIIIGNDHHHSRFLNTLSFMENCGARKISAFEDPPTLSTMVLKHAAEEHRHAFYLKKQIDKLIQGDCPTYSYSYLIAPLESRLYLNRLDVLTSRYLKQALGLEGRNLAQAAYLFVTYAIELRADKIYPLYQSALTNSGSRITVKSIILEEAGHLEEMIMQLRLFSPDWAEHAANIALLENGLFESWLAGLKEELLG